MLTKDKNGKKYYEIAFSLIVKHVGLVPGGEYTGVLMSIWGMFTFLEFSLNAKQYDK